MWLRATLVVRGYCARQESARGAARAHVGPGARWLLLERSHRSRGGQRSTPDGPALALRGGLNHDSEGVVVCSAVSRTPESSSRSPTQRSFSSSWAGVSRRSACTFGPCRCNGRGLPYVQRVALASRRTDKVPSRALSIPWCPFHWPERPFRFAFLVGLGLARVRRANTPGDFRLAGSDRAGAVGFPSGAVGVGLVSSGQNFLVLSLTRMFSMVCRPLLSSSAMAVSTTPGGISR